MSYHVGDGCFWIRSGRFVLIFTDRIKYKAPFSIRSGYQKELMLGKYGIQFRRDKC